MSKFQTLFSASAPLPPERPRRRHVENLEGQQNPEMEPNNSRKNKFQANTEVPAEAKSEAKNSWQDKFKAKSKTAIPPNFSAKNSWQSAVTNPK